MSYEKPWKNHGFPIDFPSKRSIDSWDLHGFALSPLFFLRCEPSSGETDQDLGFWLEMVKKIPTNWVQN
jgi:hypothetical protein